MALDTSVFRNEFAVVRVRRDESANGVRLHIEDVASGASIYLDPLELEALTRATHEFFKPLVDPSDAGSNGKR